MSSGLSPSMPSRWRCPKLYSCISPAYRDRPPQQQATDMVYPADLHRRNSSHPRPREGRDPLFRIPGAARWIPAFAGMATLVNTIFVPLRGSAPRLRQGLDVVELGADRIVAVIDHHVARHAVVE